MMIRQSKLIVLSIATTLASLCVGCSGSKGETFVILSTNDMHAQIDKFPALATAINACRDTTEVILVDAGDRWTGNAFVDLVEHYTPIYELINKLDYDVAIYGNHEFDKGQAYVAAANRQTEIPILGANIVSDTTSFPQPLSHYIVEVKGKKIAFVGVTGNYAGNNLPAGKFESYEGIHFTDPQTTAQEYAELSEQCDMLVLVSHCGLERDVEFASSELSDGYDYIISAHSHDKASEMINGKLVSQTGSRLKNIGATTVTIGKNGEVFMSHRNIPLSNYSPDAEVAEMVEGYHHNPELNAPIGQAAERFDTSAIRNLFAETIRKKMHANIGVYHAGGVRIGEIPQGDISQATILNAEPFGSYIAVATMTQAQLKEMILTKFNDKVNIGESHYIDMIMTTPYQVVTDENGDGVDVIFKNLNDTKKYKVAMGDYIFKTYQGLNYSDGEISNHLITETLEEHIKESHAILPSSEELQSIIKESEIEKK